MLSTSAFNALLKTLEEPPTHAIFILATTEPQKIPATILSRCQRFDFQGISEEDIKSNLNRVIQSEKINVTEDAVNLISEVCEGGMRDALSLLDQSISYSTDDVVDVLDVTAVSGNIMVSDIINLIDSCFNNNQENILTSIESIISAGKEIPKIVSDIISFLRDMLMFKTGFGNKNIYKDKKFIHLCNQIPNNLIYSWLNELNEVQNNIKFTNQKRAYLELGLLKMSDKQVNDYQSLVLRVSELEKQIILLQSNKINDSIKPSTYNFKVENKVYDEANYSLENFNENIIVDDSFITVKDVSNILYNGNKQLKEELSKKLLNEIENNKSEPLLNLMNNVIVGARSDLKAVFILSDDAVCNRIMRSENYEKLLSILINMGIKIDGFICISKNTWDTIMNDFKSKYNKDNNPKPILNDIKILVKKYKPQEKKESEIISIAKELFPNVDIKEKGE